MSKTLKTTEEALKELLQKKPDLDKEGATAMARKMNSLGMLAKLLGLDILICARHPELGTVTALSANFAPDGNEWEYSGTMLAQLIDGVLSKDPTFVIAIVEGMLEHMEAVDYLKEQLDKKDEKEE